MKLEKFHEDERGTIWKLILDNNTVYNIIETKAGYMRSGDIHPNNQHDLVLKGEVAIMERLPMKYTNDHIDKTYLLKDRDYMIIDKGVPHTFKSITDSIVMEWWDGPFSCEYHKELREFIEKENQKLYKQLK